MLVRKQGDGYSTILKENFGPGVYAGLVGRFLIWSYLGWIAMVALHVIRANRLKEISLSFLSPIGTHTNARANPINKT
jgi:hypothetical protein